MKGSEKISRNTHKTSNKLAINTYLSIICLNVNGLHAPIKRHGYQNRLKIQYSFMCCLQETHLRPKDTSRLKVRGETFIMQMMSSSRNSNTYIGETRLQNKDCM